MSLKIFKIAKTIHMIYCMKLLKSGGVNVSKSSPVRFFSAGT